MCLKILFIKLFPRGKNLCILTILNLAVHSLCMHHLYMLVNILNYIPNSFLQFHGMRFWSFVFVVLILSKNFFCVILYECVVTMELNMNEMVESHGERCNFGNLIFQSMNNPQDWWVKLCDSYQAFLAFLTHTKRDFACMFLFNEWLQNWEFLEIIPMQSFILFGWYFNFIFKLTKQCFVLFLSFLSFSLYHS